MVVFYILAIHCLLHIVSSFVYEFCCTLCSISYILLFIYFFYYIFLESYVLTIFCLIYSAKTNDSGSVFPANVNLTPFSHARNVCSLRNSARS